MGPPYADGGARREGCNDGAVPLDEHDLQTESFSNAKGWSAVRVTHVPSDMVAERHRSEALRSAVQAQRECIEELERRLATPLAEPEPGREPAVGPDTAAVTRADFAALENRVAAVERLLEGLGRG